MLIVMYVPGIPFDGESAKEQALGGSETAGWCLARELAARGHEVKVFTEGPREIIVDGVLYTPIGERSQMAPLGGRFHAFATQSPIDVLIIQRVPMGFQFHYNTKLGYLWLHDMPAGRHAGVIGSTLWNLDGLLCLTQFHADAVKEVYGAPAEAIRQTSNGVDLAEFAGLGAGIAERQKGHLLYSSRPERGLEHLVRPGGIMDRLAEAHPGQFVLHLCGYPDPPNAGNPQLQAFYHQLYAWSQRPDVVIEGHLSKRKLYELMNSVWLHCYPTEFPEISCITAMETQAAGLPILTSEFAALPETLRRAGAILLPLKDGKADEDAFVARLASLYDDPGGYDDPGEWDRLHRKALDRRASYSWSSVAAEWEGMFEARLAERSANPGALARHYLRVNDVKAAEALAKGRELPAAVMDTLAGYAWARDAASCQAYYDERYAVLAQGPSRPEFVEMPLELLDSDRAQDVSTSRLNLIRQFLRQHLKPGDAVLDFGVAEGSLSVNLARACPEFRFIGVEHAQGFADLCQAAIAKTGVQNMVVHCVTEEQLPAEAVGAKAILCAEVLEHLPDPYEVMEKLRQHVGGDPWFIATTPYGPWEALNPNQDREPRCHLWHFERQDLREMFGHLPDFKLLGMPATETEWGEKCGNFVFSFQMIGPAHRIEFARKHRRQAPPQTLALCMIARDGAGSIGRAIQSVRAIANEIFVAVDRRTTDLTREIAASYGATVFDIDAVTDDGSGQPHIGFAAARNLSIKDATSDWIFWLDCDEWLVWPERLPKYLRASCVTAFGVPQHHFSCEPLGVMKTDFPARLFRNGRGIQWFGMVHEHPELAQNEGIGHVIIAGDIAIHHAYDTEHVRMKRFARNRPLMREDAEANPDRKLRWYLELRDLSYELEERSRRGLFDADFGERVKQAEGYWAKILDEGISRIVYDAVEHWSRVNQARQIGLWFRCSLDGANFVPISAGPPQNSMPLEGRFVDRAEIERVLSLLLKDQVDPMLRSTF